MRRRAFIVLVTLCVMLIGVGALWALSSVRSATHQVLPPPVTTPTSPTTSTRPPSPSPSKTASSPRPTATIEASKPVPHGNPAEVQVSRRDKVYLEKKISGPVGLTPENGKQVLYPPPSTVGWYSQGRWKAKPGQPGPSVLVAHISSGGGKPGPFWDLTQAAKGDRVKVKYDSGDSITFIVTLVEHTKKVALPTEKIWTSTKKPVLRLITCDPDTPYRGGHYDGNVLVYADQVAGS